jgi:hypothetical protein
MWLSLVRLLCLISLFCCCSGTALLSLARTTATEGFVELSWISVNDPSAGSPTETLLRLLLPLSDMVYLIFRTEHGAPRSPKGSPDHSKSVGATGGVYKGQGLNQRKVMTCAY